MKFQFIFLLIFTTIYCLTSCSSSVNINDHIDKSSPINLTINHTDSLTKLINSTNSKILINTDKYIKLIQWFNINETGWRSTSASYISNVSLNQGSFVLLYLKGSDGVVISFIDKDNKPKQYSKSIAKGELDFLTIK